MIVKYEECVSISCNEEGDGRRIYCICYAEERYSFLRYNKNRVEGGGEGGNERDEVATKRIKKKKGIRFDLN